MNNCYFCHQVIRNESNEDHAARCGYVLEPCANKCGAYIPRNTNAQHLKTCRNNVVRAAKSSENLLSHDTTYNNTFPRANHNFQPIDQFQRSPSRSGHAQPYLMSPKYSNIDRYQSQIIYNPHVQTPYDGYANSLPRSAQVDPAMSKLFADVKMLQVQNHTLVDWRTNVQYQMDQLVGELQKATTGHKNDALQIKMQELAKDLMQVRNALNGQQVTFKSEQVETRHFQNDIEARLREAREFFVQELGAKAMILQEHQREIDRIAMANDEYKRENADQQNAIASLQKELKEMQMICTTLQQKLTTQETNTADLKRALAEINLNKELTEKSYENVQGLIATQPGRLVWKINDFDLKLDNAKEHERTPLRSPIFYTADYGYRIRLFVYLNGLKKWRGRHLLACLHVLKGDYDDLLKWPCKIEANVLLRDVENFDKPKDFVRYITAKRNYPEDSADDPQESSTQYIFIPHATLMKETHLKNGAFYLEILVHNQ